MNPQHDFNEAESKRPQPPKTVRGIMQMQFDGGEGVVTGVVAYISA